MNFKVSSATLNHHLNILSSVISSGNKLPVLNDFLFEIDASNLYITASDLENTIKVHLEIESDIHREITVPSRLLLDTLKNLPEQPIVFEINDNNTLDLKSSFGKYTFSYDDGTLYPKPVELDNPSKIVVIADILASAIHKTTFACANNDLRPVLKGVLFKFNRDGMTFVATDSHRLALYSRNDFHAIEKGEIIVNKKSLNLIKTICSGKENNVVITYNEHNAKFKTNNVEITCRLIDDKFPVYENVIPNENPNTLSINRQLFLNSLKRVSLFSNPSYSLIILDVQNNKVTISAEDFDYNYSAVESLESSYDGDPLVISFRAKTLIEMVSLLESDDISLEMSTANKPGIIKPLDGIEDEEEILMLAMSYQVNENDKAKDSGGDSTKDES